ncbi:MAG: YfhO family protein [Chloroflexi bacterium]|nr:YfhO family protein [Chloroflexota bacterium]
MILVVAASVWLIAFLIAITRAVTLSEAKGLHFTDKILRSAQNDPVRDLIAIGLIGAATLGFFWRVIFGGAWMPAGGGDLAQFLFPTYSFAAEWLRHGVIPLWNPHLFGGMPFVGDIQSGIFYPLNLLTFFISSPLTFRDMELLSILHFLIAGAGMYLYLRFTIYDLRFRTLRLSRLASLAGALAFEFSDLFITHFGNLNLIATIAWMPLILLFYQRAITDRRASFTIISGILLATAFHAGHIQMFLFILIALALFAIFHTFKLDADKRGQTRMNFLFFRVHPRLSASNFILLAGIVAFGLSAPQLLPGIEMAQNTVRAEFSYIQAAEFSLPPAQLIGLVVPGFFGRGPQAAWGPWQRVEVGYIGILPLVLAMLALILRRDSHTRFFGLFALIGLALALGGYSILHGWLYQFVPGFGQLRAPARFIVLFDFALAALAAFGFDALLHALPRASEIAFKRFVRVAPWAFLLIALSAGATAYAILILGQGQDAVLFARIANATNALAFFILLFALSIALVCARATRFFRPRAWAVLALALIFFDLFSLGAHTDISDDDPTREYDHPGAVAFLQSQGGLFRIDPRGTGVDHFWTADTAILYGLYDVGGDNPLVLADFNRYWENYGSRSSRLYDLLNTRFLIGRKNIALDREKFRVAFDGAPGLNIYENTRVLPRAFVV